jgi:hypothetical protein
VSLREDLIEVLAEELEADCNPVVALDTVLDYLGANADEWDRAALAIATSDRISQLLPVDFLAALRIQENQ